MKHIKNRLDAFVAGEMDPDEQVQITRHLARCADCAARVAEAQVLWDLLGEAAEPQSLLQARPSLWPRIQARTTAQRGRRWVNVAAATVALAAGLALAVVLPTRHSQDSRVALSDENSWGSAFWFEDQSETTFSELWLAAVGDGSGS